MSVTLMTLGKPLPPIAYLTKPGRKTRVDLNLPKYQDTPENALKTLAAGIHLLGGRDIGAIELDDKGSKVLYSYTSSGQQVVFEDIPASYQTSAKAAMPKSTKWAVVYSCPQSQLARFQHVVMGKFGVFGAYSDIGVMDYRIQNFMLGLGYGAECIGSGSGNGLGSNSGFGVLAGNGEHGRTDYVISPNFGALMRMSEYMLTDLPLAPTKPIDAGMWKFCQVCSKCADQCPSAAIPKEKNATSWEPSGLWNGPGRKAYHIDYPKCAPWRFQSGHTLDAGPGGCTNCQIACVFTRSPGGSIHPAIRTLVSQTSIFNSFFRAMDDNFGYGQPFVTPLGEVRVDPDTWWDRDLESYPFKGRVMGDGWA